MLKEAILLLIGLYTLILVLKAIRKQNNTIMITFGSGGHTSEMLMLIKGINFSQYSHTYFVVAHTDKLSQSKIIAEAGHLNITLPPKPHWITLYRSREVKQSYLSSILTTLIATAHSIIVAVLHSPNIVSSLADSI
jgi:beta-1,4-N-acetylglucosaminyltransferase